MEFIAAVNQPQFDNLQNELRRELDPQGFLEQEVFHALVSAAWNRRRVLTLLNALAAPGLDPLADVALAKQYDRLAQYESRHQREFFKALKELKALQTARTPHPAGESAARPQASAPAAPAPVPANLLPFPPPVERQARAIPIRWPVTMAS